ncbi:hypothetical protein ATCCB_0041 [Lactobacillus phage ATCCB]|nr:hypothetical protein ATCCB_0041 [Lactobacillus phage ATCCB]
MNEKDLLENGVHVVMEEAKHICFMEKGRVKDNSETSSVLFGFSKFIESLENFIDRDNFSVFVDDIFTMVNSYLSDEEDYENTINEMTQYETAFSKEFLK